MTGASPRRLGRKDSTTRARLLDAAEQLMIEEGYASVTSRRVAAAADLKPQLVHYYFRTMDDLFVEMFRRRADANYARFEKAIADEPSIGTLWRLNADLRGSAVTLEFAALANHRSEVRAEIALYSKRFRDLQLDAITDGLERAGVTEIPPLVSLVIMTGIGQVMAIETGLGISEGHDETIAYIEAAIEQMEASGRADA